MVGTSHICSKKHCRLTEISIFACMRLKDKNSVLWNVLTKTPKAVKYFKRNALWEQWTSSCTKKMKKENKTEVPEVLWVRLASFGSPGTLVLNTLYKTLVIGPFITKDQKWKLKYNEVLGGVLRPPQLLTRSVVKINRFLMKLLLRVIDALKKKKKKKKKRKEKKN